MKKIISLLMICAMIMSMAVIVSAADTGVTISLVASEPKEAYGMTYYEIAVKMDKFYTAEASLEAGYIGVQLDIVADSAEKGYFVAFGTDGDLKYSKAAKNPFTGAIAGWNTENLGTLSASVINSTTGRLVNESKDKANEVIIQNSFDNSGDTIGSIWYVPNEGATGKVSFTATGVECAAVNVTHKTDDFSYDYSAATINLGGEEEGDDDVVVPEKSTVKTFPKLYWNETEATLTTVGVIAVGQDFDTIKYGINIEKADSTVNYWATEAAVKTTDGAKAFYAIKLGGISDTTDIKATAAAKAILDNETEAGATVTKDSEGTYEE